MKEKANQQTVYLLGRQPELSLAELRRLDPTNTYQLVAFNVTPLAITTDPSPIDFTELAGSLKVGRLLYDDLALNIKALEDAIVKASLEIMGGFERTKVTFGLSCADPLLMTLTQIERTKRQLKESARSIGKNLRSVPNKEFMLNSAQTTFNKLHQAANAQNLELLIFKTGRDRAAIAVIDNVQDMYAFSQRDQNRPKRDAFVGMLPPKLARILVNIVRGNDIAPETKLLLDPFCGTGVVLQEAQLLGMNVYGTDIAPKMIDYSIANMDWFRRMSFFARDIDKSLLMKTEIGDATTYDWADSQKIDYVCGETYLGQPLRLWPHPDKLKIILKDVDHLHYEFLRNLRPQLSSTAKICLALPAWKNPESGVVHTLPLLDQIERLGYTSTELSSHRQGLIYIRPGQYVARHIVLLQPKTNK
jgi:tRNA G10  N-methylase Trm11